jgi:amino acid adenylation domain-containing protein
MTAALLGVLKAGHAYVPLDPYAPAARLARIWADAEPAAIVTAAVHADLARELAGGAPVVVMDPAPRLPSRIRVPHVPPDAPAYVLYTSGSTGEPKGVVQSHRNVLYFIRTYTANLQLGPTDTLMLVAAYGFDAAVMDIFGALLNGATLCPFSLRDGTPRELADWIDEKAITVVHSTPTVFRTLTSSLEPERILSSVRLVVLGGEAAFRSDAEQFARHFPSSCLLVNGLGPTESTVTLQSFTAHGDRLTRSALAVGYPVEGTRVRLVDDNGYDAEVFGEIVVESPHVALGYWKRDDLTHAAFQQIAPDGNRRRYRTGDLARRLPDGRLEFLGRNDRQIKIRGYRIELGEVEAVLAAHPNVRECAVTMASDARGAGRLAAYVVPRDGQAPSTRELRQFVAARLPDPMVPSAFVPLEALPLRANGKVDRDALPPPRFELSSAEFVAPRDTHERQMADLWRDVLGVDRVGVHDNFFELGGDSIKAIRITGMLRAAGVAITPWLLFQYQTIADLIPALVAMPPQDEAAAAHEPSGSGFELTDERLAELAARVEFEVS